MFQAGHELGLGTETADELRVVGERAPDHLHRDLALDRRLKCPVHLAKRTRTNSLEQAVAAQRCSTQLVRGTLLENVALEPPELRRGVEAQLVHEHLARSAIRLQRLSLAPSAVQRDHEFLPEPFAQRVAGDQLFELGNDVPMSSKSELCGDPLLGRDQPQLFQMCDLGLQ
jgi:hypothetical protein